MRNVFPDGGAEVIEVIAAHLHDAYKAAGDDPDSDELRARAKDAYVQAGDRAEAVGAPGAAETAYLTAAELSSDDEERARFIEKSAEMAMRIGADDRALNGFEKAAAFTLGSRSHRGRGSGDGVDRGDVRQDRQVRAGGRPPQRRALVARPCHRSPRGRRPPGGAVGKGPHVHGSQPRVRGPIERALTLAQHHELGGDLRQRPSDEGVPLQRRRPCRGRHLEPGGEPPTAREHGLVQVESAAQNLLTTCA